MAWWFAVIESRHELQNPTSPEKILRLGRSLNLGAGSHVLDVGSGRGGPALLLAEHFGSRVTCIERSEEFVTAARRRATEKGLDDLIEVVQDDASAVSLDDESYDAALCLGASFALGGFGSTLQALMPAVRPGGYVAVGEPYWRRRELPTDFERPEGYDFLTLAETVRAMEDADLEPVDLIASSRDDWDRYETLHWATLDDWLRADPTHPEADDFRRRGRQDRERYLRWDRDLLGWAIFVGRKAG